MYDSGADIVYAAAGGTGDLRLYKQQRTIKNAPIGVDSNQNHLQPGSVLTSMLGRVDVAAYEVFKSGFDGSWKPGFKILGLAQDGVGWSLDEHNSNLTRKRNEEKSCPNP